MDGQPQTRHTLLARLRAPGDEAAWHEFVGLYEPLVYRLARQRGLQDADAQDLCQEVFRTVAGAIGRWDPALGSFRAWLLRIARNLLLNLLDRQKRHPRGSGDSDVQALLAEQPGPDPETTALFDAEYRRRLFEWAAEAVRPEFTLKTWEAFWQTAVAGRRAKGVADELGMTVGAVYIARSRVLARLRAQVEQLDGEAARRLGDEADGAPADPL
jgi:RNA polymerase sigma factor (sigma-70 family)